jgi:hypothetical protein
MAEIKTVNEMITAFGGTGKTAVIFGVLPSAVSNWRQTGFPDRLHLRILNEAKRRGIAVDESIFGQVAA